MQLTRPEPITFELTSGQTITAPPATRAQMREVYRIERDVADLAERRGQIVATLLQGASTSTAEPLQVLLDSLTAEEETDIIHAFVASHHGYSPTTAVAVQQAMREMLKKKLQTTPPLQT
jgi:hypothetical protein